MAEIGTNEFGSGLSAIGAGLNDIGVPTDGNPAFDNTQPAAPAEQPAPKPTGDWANRPRITQNPLQDRVSAIEAQRRMLQRQIDNPLGAFLYPNQWRENVGKAAEFDSQIQQTQQALQKVQDDRQTAVSGGMNPATYNAVPWATANEQTVDNAWTKDLADANFNAYKHYAALGDRGKAVIEQQEPNFMPALGLRNEQAQSIIDQLDTAARTSGPAYASKVAELDANGEASKVLANYAPGFMVPKDAAAWAVRGKGVASSVGMARQIKDQYDFQQAQLSTLVQPETDKPSAEAFHNSLWKDSQGAALNGGDVVKLPTGERGLMYGPGSIDPGKYGKAGGWNNMNPATYKTYDGLLNDEQGKGLQTKYKAAQSFQRLVNDDKTFDSAAGVASVYDQFGGMEANVAEGSKKGGSIGITRQFESQFGPVDAFFNGLARAKSAFDSKLDSWVAGGKVGPQPRLDETTIAGLKQAAAFQHDMMLTQVKERIGEPLHEFGRLGGDLKRSGLDPELQNDPAIVAMRDAGRQEFLKDYTSYKYTNKGDHAILLPPDSPNKSAKSFVVPKDAPPPVVAPSPGHENPPANGAVLPSMSGEKRDNANVQLAWAKSPDNPFPGVASHVQPAKPDATVQPNVTPNGAAFLSMIRGSESNGTNANSYSLINGGQRMTNYDDHPRVMVPQPNGTKSSAAGAGQMLASTWDEEKAKYSFALDKNKDGSIPFTPQNQDKANWYLAQDKYREKTGGNLEKDLSDPSKHAQIMAALNKTWTSLPGGAEPNNATASRTGALRGYLQKFGSMYTNSEGTPNAISAQPELNPDVQKARVAGGELTGAGAAGGAAVGSAVAGPVGGMVGGGIGGGGAQMLSNYGAGKPLTEGALKEAALGATFGFVPEARPVLGMLTRSAGAGVTEGANEALTDPAATPSKVFWKGAEAAGTAAAGEGAFRTFATALGRPGAHFGEFNTATQQEIMDAGEVVARGKPEAPKATAGGVVSDAAKAEHEAAVKEYDDAIDKIEARRLDPEDVVHAVNQVKRFEGTNTGGGQSVLAGAAEKAKRDVGGQLNDIAADVAKTGVGTPKSGPAANGPLSLVGKAGSGVINTPDMVARMTQAENDAFRPAKTVGERYQNIFEARSNLIADANGWRGATPPDENTRRSLMAAADNLGDHQRDLLKYTYGDKKGGAMADKIENLRGDYAKLSNLAKDGDIVGAMARTDEQGAEARRVFKKYASEDVLAQRFANTLVKDRQTAGKGAGGKLAHYATITALGALGMPVGVAAILAGEMPGIMNGWAVRRAAGGPASLKLLLQKRASMIAQEQMKNNGAAQRGAAAAGRGLADATNQPQAVQ